jgi:CO dehydrogenase maturation factor
LPTSLKRHELHLKKTLNAPAIRMSCPTSENVNKSQHLTKTGKIVKIAVSGKGGVGKTLIAAGLAASFADKGLKTLAIDADSSPNLALTLGITPKEARKILPISDNKELIESKTITEYPSVYRLSFTVDDVVRKYSVATPSSVDLIVMGTVKSMGSGCTCPANAVLRALLRHLIVERDEAVVLDMEAGVEHMGRGTARNVDKLLIVADANFKALEIAKHIQELATKAGMKEALLVGNKVADDSQKATINDFGEENGLEILGFVPFDQKIAESEMHGETPIRDKNSKAMLAIQGLCEELMSKRNQ